MIQYFELVSCSNNECIFHNYNLHFVWKISEIIFWIPLFKLQTSKKTCGFCWMFWLTDSPMRYLKNSNYSLSMPVPVPLNFPPLVLIISISRYHHLILHVISCATILTVPPSNKKSLIMKRILKTLMKNSAPLLKARRQVWESRVLGDDRCGTLKNPYFSMTMSAEHWLKFSVLHL